VKRRKLAVFSGILFILALATIPVSTPTAFAPLSADTLSVCPDYTWQPEGAIFGVGICVPAGITNLMGYDVAVAFDSSVIEILGVFEGPLPQAASDTTFFWWFNSGVRSDHVHVNGAVLGATMDGPGVLFTLMFKARHSVASTTNVCITYSELRDGINDPIAHERKCGLVEIGMGPTGIEPPNVGGFRLECFPNPFNPSITLVLSPPESGGKFAGASVSIDVYSADGRLVRSLFNGFVNPGERRFVWDGGNESGEEVSSGVYFAVAKTEAGTVRTKLVLVR
jgi:hypothetical protein